MANIITVTKDDHVAILHHGSDFDGECSAAVVYNYFSPFTSNIELVPLEHDTKDKLDIKTLRNKIVIMVDFSLEAEKMFVINRISKKFYWVDHHISAMNDYTKYHQENPEENAISGLRESLDRAACELSYLYFFDDKIPYSIKLLSQYDSSNDIYDEKNDINMLPFQYGLKCYDTSDIKSKLWKDIVLNKNIDMFVAEVIQKGKSVLEYEKVQNEIYLKLYGQTGSLIIDEDNIIENVGIVNKGLPNPIFNSIMKNTFDLSAVYVHKAGIGYTVSLYSKDIDCSEIAVKFGGGGHAGAAGFRCQKLPIKID